MFVTSAVVTSTERLSGNGRKIINKKKCIFGPHRILVHGDLEIQRRGDTASPSKRCDTASPSIRCDTASTSIRCETASSPSELFRQAWLFQLLTLSHRHQRQGSLRFRSKKVYFRIRFLEYRKYYFRIRFLE